MPKARTSQSRRVKSPQVSGLDAHLGFWLRFVSNHVSDSFRRRVEKKGVSVSEWVALRALYGAEVSNSRALVDALGMTKGAVSKLLDRLEHKQLVRRLADPDDARAQRVALTPAGRRLVPVLAGLADENDAHYFGQLTPQKQRVLADILQEIVRSHQFTQLPTQ